MSSSPMQVGTGSRSRKLKTLPDVQKILSKISFAPNCMDMGWEWESKEISEGFLVRCSFRRPDIYKQNEVGMGFGRWMFFERDCSTAGIVKTCWLCAKLIVEHELMEAFHYRGARIFNPHKSLTDLAHPQVLEPNTGME